MGGGSQKSSGRSTETSLSKEQANILKMREAQYQRFFAPRIFAMMDRASQPGFGTTFSEQAVGKVNQAFSGALTDFGRQAARRGMAGSGFEAAGLAGLAASRASAVSDAVRQGEQQAVNQQMQLFQIGQGVSPTPTTAAPIGQTQKSSGWDIRLA